MSKIICEVCGTSYQETAEQCPICGCVRSVETNAVAESATDSHEAAHGSYTYVKGGRFSKANVKKRNRALPAATAVAEPEPEPAEQAIETEDNASEDEAKSALDKWLTAAIIVLLLSIVAIVVYIAVAFFDVKLPQFIKPEDTTPSTTAATTEATTQPTTAPTTAPSATTEPQDVACQALRIDSNVIRLEKVGAAALLNIEVVPASCTESIVYASANESVATVTESGKVVAVGKGTTTVTATCGLITLECTVSVSVEDEPVTAPTTEPTTAPTTEPTTAPTTAPKQLAFNVPGLDFTLFFEGDSWYLYSGDVDKSLITWSSDNESVATFNNGKVVAVGPGTTKVHAQYNGEKLSCIVRCNFSTETTQGTEPTESTEPSSAPTEPTENGGADAPSEDNQDKPAGTSSISHTDVTIKIGESFNLVLRDPDGNAVSVSWHTTSTDYCTVSGNTVTGKAVGYTKVYTEYNGREYACDVHVKSA